jgi:hypothetical protein
MNINLLGVGSVRKEFRPRRDIKRESLIANMEETDEFSQRAEIHEGS